jgi:hypothetical protein
VNLYCLWEDRENACSEPVWFCAQLLANPREIPCSNCHHFNNHIRRYQCPIGTPESGQFQDSICSRHHLDKVSCGRIEVFKYEPLKR